MTGRSSPRRRLIPSVIFGIFGALAILALLLLVSDVADARIGGGHSYGGGRGGGGGGWGGGGDGAGYIVYLLIQLCFRYPLIGVPLAIGALVIYSRTRDSDTPVFRSGVASDTTPTFDRATLSEQIRKLRADDPNFSKPLFLEFVRLLYVRVQTARGSGVHEAIRPYIAPQLLADLTTSGLQGIDEVVVGSATIQSIRRSASKVAIRVQLEASLRERRGGSRGETLYSREVWHLSRAADVISKGPGEITALDCPSCGSPIELDVNGTCRHCGEIVTRGNYHWQLSSLRVLERRAPSLLELAPGGGPEPGLERPTVYSPRFAAARRQFQLRYPDFEWSRFEQRVREAFLHLNEAWSQKQWEKARPYETDTLFDTHRFWIARYEREGITNRIEEIEIERIEPCAIEPDAFFECLTVRIYSSMLDYSVADATGKIVGGSRSVRRRFSEYWTFIQRIGFVNGQAKESERCPSCAAPLEISMAGICKFCGSLVTSGEFDWVLCAIEQDEAYQG